jgi:hypothetical protein
VCLKKLQKHFKTDNIAIEHDGLIINGEFAEFAYSPDGKITFGVSGLDPMLLSWVC